MAPSVSKEFRLQVPESVLSEVPGEVLLLAGMAVCEDPDEGSETYYWTKRALLIADSFWGQFVNHSLGKSDGS